MVSRKKFIGTWIGGGLVPIRLVFRSDRTFKQSSEAVEQSTPGRLAECVTESGKWLYDGRALTRTILQSSDKKRIGMKTEDVVVRLDDDELRLEQEGGCPWTCHRVRVFRGWTLPPFCSTTDPGKLPDLWEAVAGSKSYRIRKGVNCLYQERDGAVYHLPDRSVFYVQCVSRTTGVQTYHGPYQGDPRKLLNLPRVKRPGPEEEGKPNGETRAEGCGEGDANDQTTAWGKEVEGVQVRARLERNGNTQLPVLLIDVRNRGKEDRWINLRQGTILVSSWAPFQSAPDDLPVSSHQYEGPDRESSFGRILEPGESITDVRIPLDARWTRPEYEGGGTPRRISLRWTAGRNAIQFLLRIYGADAGGNISPSPRSNGVDAIAAGVPLQYLPDQDAVCDRTKEFATGKVMTGK
jgi:hypothetical protein